MGTSCHWCLGITGMTTMLSPSTLPWELCRWHCVSRVSLVHALHTHSTAEGNVSRALQAMVTNSGMDPTKRPQRDKWVPQGHFFQYVFSPCVLSFSSNTFQTRVRSYLFICCFPSPCSKTFAFGCVLQASVLLIVSFSWLSVTARWLIKESSWKRTNDSTHILIEASILLHVDEKRDNMIIWF